MLIKGHFIFTKELEKEDVSYLKKTFKNQPKEKIIHLEENFEDRSETKEQGRIVISKKRLVVDGEFSSDTLDDADEAGTGWFMDTVMAPIIQRGNSMVSGSAYVDFGDCTCPYIYDEKNRQFDCLLEYDDNYEKMVGVTKASTSELLEELKRRVSDDEINEL